MPKHGISHASKPARKILRRIVAFLFLIVPSAQAADCTLGYHFGLRDTGALLQSSCGTQYRLIFAKTITHDENATYGFLNNHYSYMFGVGYRLQLKKHRFDIGAVYIDRETKLFLQKQYAAWLKWSYAISPRFYCGYSHQSVPFVDDAGRNQIGCDLTFDF